MRIGVNLVGLQISHFTNVTSTSIIFKNKQVVYNYSQKISSNQIDRIVLHSIHAMKQLAIDHNEVKFIFSEIEQGDY